jgi:hypothetical protein
MVKLKCSALYTDNLGCEQATVYFSKEEFQLKVRGCIFKNESLNFDFSLKNSNKTRHLFYLKDDELIEYVIDIKIPLTLLYNNKVCIEEFLLRIERRGNYYNNSLSFYLNGIIYSVEGYDLQELLINMHKELPEEYDMKDSFSLMFGAYSLKYNKENDFYCLKNIEEEWKIESKRYSYLSLFNFEYKRKFKKLQKVPITYIKLIV